MLVVQKQPNLPHTSPYSHRRHPSAPPAVVVQPTRIPGLLSLSKPQQQQRHSPQQRPPRTPAAARTTQPAPAHAPTSPSPAARGRQAKDKTVVAPRSDSASAHRHARQPSPPQAEDLSTPARKHPQPPSNSDPFLLSTSSPNLSRPSGKLARRRQQQQQTNPAPQPTQPVSIPQPSNQNPAKPLSRSVPLPRTRTRTRIHNSTVALLPPWDFPICDDMTEAGDVFDSETPAFHPSPPVTPTRRNASRTQVKPPPFTPPSVSVQRRTGGRNHKRAPSDSGMLFNMSSDESGPETLSQADRDEDLKNLLTGLTIARCMQPPQTPPREGQQGYFASSMFQNSPSPEDLPEPLFI